MVNYQNLTRNLALKWYDRVIIAEKKLDLINKPNIKNRYKIIKI